jgi:hypothetical protein
VLHRDGLDLYNLMETVRNERSSFATSRFQRHQKERRDRLNRKNGEAHILAYPHLSYGHHRIIAAIPTKMATKRPGITATSMIPS